MPTKKSIETTKNKIKDAFLTLYENKSIDRISIRELTNLAGINRVTFYSHYIDIYDLLEKIEDEKFEIFMEKLNSVIPKVMEGADFRYLMPDKEFFDKNIKWMKILIATNGKSNMINKIKEELRHIVCDKLGLKEENMDKETSYLIDYIVYAHSGLVSSWINNGMDIEGEIIMNLMFESMTSGPVTVILNKHK